MSALLVLLLRGLTLARGFLGRVDYFFSIVYYGS